MDIAGFSHPDTDGFEMPVSGLGSLIQGVYYEVDAGGR